MAHSVLQTPDSQSKPPLSTTWRPRFGRMALSARIVAKRPALAV